MANNSWYGSTAGPYNTYDTPQTISQAWTIQQIWPPAQPFGPPKDEFIEWVRECRAKRKERFVEWMKQKLHKKD